MAAGTVLFRGFRHSDAVRITQRIPPTSGCRVPSENAIIRCNMWALIPMGRDVVFYITVGNLQSDSGDFVTSVTVEQPAGYNPADPAPSSQTPSSQTPSSASPSSSKASGSEASSAPSSSGESSSSEDFSSEDSSLTVGGLVEFDESGNGGLILPPKRRKPAAAAAPSSGG